MSEYLPVMCFLTYQYTVFSYLVYIKKRKFGLFILSYTICEGVRFEYLIPWFKIHMS